MRRIKFYALLLAIIFSVVGIVFFCASNAAYLQRINNGNLQAVPIESTTTPGNTTPSSIAPSTHNYKDALAKLEAERLRLASRLQHASRTERAKVIAEARTIITRSIYDDLFSAWYGTPWDFNGTSETPQQGKIACGYFVSTIFATQAGRLNESDSPSKPQKTSS